MSKQNIVIILLDDSLNRAGEQRYICDSINEYVDRLKPRTLVQLRTFNGDSMEEYFNNLAKEWQPLRKESLRAEGACRLYNALYDTLEASEYVDTANNVVLVVDVGGMAESAQNDVSQKARIQFARDHLEPFSSAGWGLLFVGSGKDMVAAHNIAQQGKEIGMSACGTVHEYRTEAYKKIAKMTKNYFKQGTFGL